MPTRRELEQALAAAENRISVVLESARLRAKTPDEQREFDAAGAECDRIEAELKALGHGTSTRPGPPATSRSREADRESMRRQLRAYGMTPRTDPGVGLPPAQASMARLLASGAR